MEKITREQAKLLNLKYYFTGNPCKFGHISKRSVSNCSCYQCTLQKTRNWRVQNTTYHSNYSKQYSEKNKDKLKEYYKSKYLHDKQFNYFNLLERTRNSSRKYINKHKDKCTQRYKLWVLSNKDKINTLIAKRRATKNNATPNWANKQKIQEIYQQCELINICNKLVGGTELFVVDHVIPLRGRNVCGLHVENNLQIVLASYNLTKSNKLLDIGE